MCLVYMLRLITIGDRGFQGVGTGLLNYKQNFLHHKSLRLLVAPLCLNLPPWLPLTCLLLAALAPSLATRSYRHHPLRAQLQRSSPAAAHATNNACSARSVHMLGRFPLPPSSYQLRNLDGSCIMGTLCDAMDAYFAKRQPYSVDPHVVDIITSAL